MTLEPDESKYGMEVPEEWAELLRQDADTEQYFDKLTPGKQRRILYIIGQPKTTETRLRKAVRIAEYLYLKNGEVDLMEMNDALKGK